jgi:hypothetical protein
MWKAILKYTKNKVVDIKKIIESKEGDKFLDIKRIVIVMAM